MESLKRSSYVAGLDVGNLHNNSSIDSDDSFKSDDRSGNGSRPETPLPKNGKKTRGRVKISMEFIDNKLRRYTTFSKRKSGIMKKAHELATLTGTQVMLLVASETGHVYTFATRKLQPILSSEAGKQLIQTCLNSPDANDTSTAHTEQDEQRMSAQGFEETELSYAPTDDTKDGLLQKTYHMLNAISAQQHTIPSSTNEQRNANPTVPVNLVTMGNNTEPNKSSHIPSQPSFTLLSASTGPSQLEQHRLQLAHSAAGAVRMQMLSPEGFTLSDNAHHTHHQLQPNVIGRSDEGHLALFNHTFPIQRPITGVHPVLVETSQTTMANNIISTQHHPDTTRPR